MTLLPKTKLGTWSIWLFILMIVLFVGGNLYQESQGPTETTGINWLMIPGFVAGFVAAGFSLYAIIKEKERSVLVLVIPFIILVLVIAGSIDS